MEGRREKETVIGKYGMGKDYWTESVRKGEKRGETAKHMTKKKTEYCQLQN